MQDLVNFAKALADPTRLRILALLEKDELCVCEIADALVIPQSSLSTHLQALRHGKLVRATKRGTWAYYAIEDEARPVLAALESQFGTERDPTLVQDRERLQARLALRENGCCVIGYGQIIRLGERQRS
jgi:ArsR family transcriptional regulator